MFANHNTEGYKTVNPPDNHSETQFSSMNKEVRNTRNKLPNKFRDFVVTKYCNSCLNSLSKYT